MFYQDSEYTYLITDEIIGKNAPSRYYEEYTDGSKVSKIGQRLNPMISSIFIESNTNANIRATAWLTDPEVWSEYANNDAVFAIGSPTIELFAKSYNSTGKTDIIILEKGTIGYTENTDSGWIMDEYNYGIYNKDGSTDWWIASPARHLRT